MKTGGKNMTSLGAISLMRLVEVLCALGLIALFCAPNAEAFKPRGWMDVADCNVLTGWARDPDTIEPIRVAVFVDGTAETGAFLGSIEANTIRHDLSFNDKDHGFVFQVPPFLRDGRAHSVYVYGIDPGWDGNNLLNGAPKTIVCPAAQVAVPVAHTVQPYPVATAQAVPPAQVMAASASPIGAPPPAYPAAPAPMARYSKEGLYKGSSMRMEEPQPMYAQRARFKEEDLYKGPRRSMEPRQRYVEPAAPMYNEPAPVAAAVPMYTEPALARVPAYPVHAPATVPVETYPPVPAAPANRVEMKVPAGPAYNYPEAYNPTALPYGRLEVPWVINSGGHLFRWNGVNWRRLPWTARDLGVLPETPLATTAHPASFPAPTSSYGLYNYGGADWMVINGGAVHVDVDITGKPWLVNSHGDILRWNGVAWEQLPGKANDIGIGADGSIWKIGTDPAPGGYAIYQWNGKDWKRQQGAAMRIDVDSEGTPWVVDAFGYIFRKYRGKWQRMPGNASDVACSPDGVVWITGTNAMRGGYGLYRWSGQDWIAVRGDRPMTPAIGVNPAYPVMLKTGSQPVSYIAGGAGGLLMY